MASFSPEKHLNLLRLVGRGEYCQCRAAEVLLMDGFCGRGALVIYCCLRKLGTGSRPQPKFRVIALAEENSIHKPFVDAAKVWLRRSDCRQLFDRLHPQHTKDRRRILSRYRLFIQLTIAVRLDTHRCSASEMH